ncbi:unnamed protein product [Auanema sp. JU1783]|nr:unnamed protein product [Auanema sp. JU1783]
MCMISQPQQWEQYYVGDHLAAGNPYMLPMRQTEIGHDYHRIAPAMIAITPNTVPNSLAPAVHEPIEAGCLPSSHRRRRSGSYSEVPAEKAPAAAAVARRSGITWETMTDEEREEAQRIRRLYGFRKEEAFKTALCDAYKKNEACPYGESCRFAHGENELRLPAQPRGKAHPKYKTQLCDKYSAQGHCPYGPRCQFIHKLKKGLPLLDYETLLAQGRISPAREDEITNGDNFSVPRRYIPSPSKRNSGSGSSRRLSYDSGNGRMNGSHENRTDAPVYPKMQVINIEKAYQSSDHAKPRDGRSRRRSCVTVDDMDHDFKVIDGNSMGQRTASMMSLTYRGSTENLTYAGRGKNQRSPDLSAIKEEGEENIDRFSSMSVRGLTKREANNPNHWSEMIFGRRMDVINEDDKEQHTGSGSNATDTAFFSESCDEELLAQGLYNKRYPDASVEKLKQWKNNNC